jgi:esterase/lipase superfamily enzyme
MNREYHAWWSPALGRRMELLVFGHHGARVLVFPTSRGRFYKWEDHGMFGPAGLGDHIAQGWLQVFCVDSADAESWYNYAAHPGHRGWRQTQYMNYIVGEVLPFTQAKNGNPFLIVLGASFGAYHAVCFAFKFPHLVGRVIGDERASTTSSASPMATATTTCISITQWTSCSTSTSRADWPRCAG